MASKGAAVRMCTVPHCKCGESEPGFKNQEQFAVHLMVAHGMRPSEVLEMFPIYTNFITTFTSDTVLNCSPQCLIVFPESARAHRPNEMHYLPDDVFDQIKVCGVSCDIVIFRFAC
jgi:hypothetical protein